MELRPLGTTDIRVTPVALGCWPVSGMTTLGVSWQDGLDTIAACFDAGINFLDTAYMYGAEGESERLIAEALGPRRDEMVIATKVGVHWEGNQRVHGADAATIRRECEECLRRLQTDRVELLYLHAPDPGTPIEETAAGLRQLMEAGKTRSVGVSNVSLDQLRRFHAVCPVSAFQPPYNMLDRRIEADTLPWCREHRVSVMVYWPLLKGLLAGKLPRDFVPHPSDGRAKYPMFQGREWQKNQDLIDRLRRIAAEAGRSVAQLVINWTIHQPGITSALCGARKPEQTLDNAGGMGWQLSADQLARIDQALKARGAAALKDAV